MQQRDENRYLELLHAGEITEGKDPREGGEGSGEGGRGTHMRTYTSLHTHTHTHMHTLPTPPPLCLSAFSTHQFYFSHTYDVTLTMQKIRTASSDHLTGPRWQRANPKVRGVRCAV